MNPNPYLARVRALNSEKGIPQTPPKPAKLGFDSFDGPQGMGVLENHPATKENQQGFVSFDGSQGIGFSKNHLLLSAGSESANCKKGIPRTPTKPAKPDAFIDALCRLEARCPDYVDVERWRSCVSHARQFLATWGNKAEDLGWRQSDLFGLHQPPAKPAANYARLSRRDCTGLLWVLPDGERIAAMTEASATIITASGATVTYRRRE